MLIFLVEKLEEVEGVRAFGGELRSFFFEIIVISFAKYDH